MPDLWLITEEGLQAVDEERAIGDGPQGPPPDPGSLLLGSSSQDDWDVFNAKLDNLLGVRRSFNPADLPATWAASAAGSDVAREVASMWSFKPEISAVNAGSLDAAMTSFFNSIPAGHRAWITMWHEPFDDIIQDGTFTASEFRSAQARAHGLLHDSDADTSLVQWGFILTAFDFQQGRHVDVVPDAFDWVGVDGYNFWRPPAAPAPHGQNRTPQQVFGPAATFTATTDKPLIVAEFGHHADPAVPSWRPDRLQETVDWCVDNDVAAACYFNSSVGDRGPWWLTCYENWTTRGDQSNIDAPSMDKYRDLLGTYGKR